MGVDGGQMPRGRGASRWPDRPHGDGVPPWADPDWRRRRHPAIPLAVFVLIIELISAHVAERHQTGARPLDVVGNLLLVAGAAAMVVRRRWRIPAYVVSLAATVAYIIAGYPYGPVFFAVFVSIFGAVRTGHRLGVWISTAIGYLVYVFAGRIVSSVGGVEIKAPSVTTSILAAGWIIVALALAEGIRVRSERFAEIARTRAEQQRAKAEQNRRQESEERLRIARELHDVLGHHLSLINVQAGVGLHLMDEHPGQARAALEAIKEASAAALGEVRSVLGVLRASDEAAPRSPAPTLANLTSLVDPADTVVEGTPVPLPPEVDRAAYRIIQESLTNVRRHAGTGAHARVSLAYRPDALVVTVTDDGIGVAPARATGPAASGAAAGGAVSTGWVGTATSDRSSTVRTADQSGNGIAGMRARAVALGGTLVAGAGASGGFVVTATLPIRENS
ncbi:MAG TPA: histidine kinase [Micromonosporaceae bacterium]|nr:histidine kinase [Micromonosporaceae bacterium]